jgi:hypothetical protein
MMTGSTDADGTPGGFGQTPGSLALQVPTDIHVDTGPRAGSRFVPTDAGNPRQKRKASAAAIPAVVILLTALGGVALYLLGREDPREAASPPLAWGDRVERRMDAFIDGVRPKWADRVEARLEPFLDRIGWK